MDNHPLRRMQPRRGGVMAGCLVAVAIFVVLLVIGGIYVNMNWRNWAASLTQNVSVEVVKNSGLPQDQKDKIKLADLKKMGDEIASSPLIPLAGVQAARHKYIEPSDMTPEEKAAANRSLQRFARGIHEKKIPQDAIDDVVKPITTLKANGHWELKDKPTRLEVDQFVANAKAKADEAQVPDEPFDLNIAAELKKAIDKALGRG
jgi:hypothetical protein